MNTQNVYTTFHLLKPTEIVKFSQISLEDVIYSLSSNRDHYSFVGALSQSHWVSLLTESTTHPLSSQLSERQPSQIHRVNQPSQNHPKSQPSQTHSVSILTVSTNWSEFQWVVNSVSQPNLTHCEFGRLSTLYLVKMLLYVFVIFLWCFEVFNVWFIKQQLFWVIFC